MARHLGPCRLELAYDISEHRAGPARGVAHSCARDCQRQCVKGLVRRQSLFLGVLAMSCVVQLCVGNPRSRSCRFPSLLAPGHGVIYAAQRALVGRHLLVASWVKSPYLNGEAKASPSVFGLPVLSLQVSLILERWLEMAKLPFPTNRGARIVACRWLQRTSGRFRKCWMISQKQLEPPRNPTFFYFFLNSIKHDVGTPHNPVGFHHPCLRPLAPLWTQSCHLLSHVTD